MIRYQNVYIAGLGFELPPEVVPSSVLDERLAPVYRALGLPPNQIEPLSGIRERRFWPRGYPMSTGALAAARKALTASGLSPDDIGTLIYGGVCRDNLEPATATAVADGLGLTGHAITYDVSNACLGVVNGMAQLANAIELGQVRAGIVCSCETARDIIDQTINRLRDDPTIENFKPKFATLTGGSGAAAVVLAHVDLCVARRRLVGGAARGANEHHRLCRWGPDTGLPSHYPTTMETHAVEVLENGVKLGQQTWRDFLAAVEWETADKVICHQVGSANRAAILRALELPEERDFSTFPYLGNIGTVSLPLTAALAEQRGFLAPGDRVALLGIGSGLNCVMLGVEW